MKNFAINKPYIIAEVGTNHNGSIKTAMRLIDMVAEARADSVKFQIIFPEGLYLPAFYENGRYKPNPVIEQRRRLMLKASDYFKLAEYANLRNIDFSASVFDEKGLDLLLECKPRYIKVASCDLNNLIFLRKVIEKAGRSGISVILSTGFSTYEEIKRSVNIIRNMRFKDLILLHCVSVYPAALAIMNLSFIDDLRKFGFPVGLSDHTSGSIAAAVALVKGAMYFEKHVTLDKKQSGFDHAHSIEGTEFQRYVSDIHETFEALKHRTEKLSEEEKSVKKRARRALYASRDIQAGEKISEADVLIVRPEAAMSADKADDIIGKVCRANLKQFEPFTLKLFE